MKRVKRMPVGENKTKKITVRRQPKKISFIVQYADGRRIETPFIEVQGNATLYFDPDTKEPTLRTDANISLGQAVGTCAVCGGDTDDQHAHA